MSNGDQPSTLSPVPFLYEMVISFFEAARQTLDPVLQAIGGYENLGLLDDGRPGSPDLVTQKLAELPAGVHARHLGACLSATTNLGLAYVHSFRLLSFIARGTDSLPRNATKPNLAKLYDALPRELRDELASIYKQVGSHDFEMEMSAGPLPPPTTNDDEDGTKSFRSQLAYWQRRGLLHESHLSLAVLPDRPVTRFFIPLRSVLILDRILAEHVAPKLGRRYQKMDEQLSSRTESPKLEWKEDMIHVSLPDKLGRTLEARWKPTVTSVVRIRELGTEPWGTGFETPFNSCSFVDLKPETEYEIQITHKNEAGESPPAISTIKTQPASA